MYLYSFFFTSFFDNILLFIRYIHNMYVRLQQPRPQGFSRFTAEFYNYCYWGRGLDYRCT